MPQAILTVDLVFGDAGKGSIVDFLARQYAAHTVVRYNGGAQAGHRVLTDDSPAHEHVFAQFGAGTLAGAATHLSRFMLLDPPALLAEEQGLRRLGVDDAFARLTIDADALLLTPFARAVNRLRELARGAERHGSCGMGIGETAAAALRYPHAMPRAGDMASPKRLREKLNFVRRLSLEAAEELRTRVPASDAAEAELALLDDPGWLDWMLDVCATVAAQARIVPAEHLHHILNQPGTVVFEGAQGVLLDEWRGFHPHTTWSTTTLANADLLLREAGYAGQVRRIGITRAYTTRHGAGPLVSEDAALTAALPDARNGQHPWQQGFRAGWLDLVLLRYALAVLGTIDELALTCLDRLEALPAAWLCPAYEDDGARLTALPCPPTPTLEGQEQLTRLLTRCRPLLEAINAQELPTLLEAALHLPVSIVSRGPDASAKQMRESLIGR